MVVQQLGVVHLKSNHRSTVLSQPSSATELPFRTTVCTGNPRPFISVDSIRAPLLIPRSHLRPCAHAVNSHRCCLPNDRHRNKFSFSRSGIFPSRAPLFSLFRKLNFNFSPRSSESRVSSTCDQRRCERESPQVVTACISICLTIFVVFVIEFATENGFSRGPVRQQPGRPGGDLRAHAGLWNFS